MTYTFTENTLEAIQTINGLESENTKNAHAINDQIYSVVFNNQMDSSYFDQADPDKWEFATKFVAHCILNDTELKFHSMDKDERKRVKAEEFDGRPIIAQSNTGASRTLRRIDSDVYSYRTKYKARFIEAENAIACNKHDREQLTLKEANPSHKIEAFKPPKTDRSVKSNKDYLLDQLSNIAKRITSDKTNDTKFGKLEVTLTNKLAKQVKAMQDLLK